MPPKQLAISSPAFAPGKPIPKQYTCEGENVNPELKFGGVPADARSLALIMDDPDGTVGIFVHWLVWNIAPDTTVVPFRAPAPVGIEGTTSFGTIGYGGPCPPPGKTHRYVFRLYALDAILDLPPGASRVQLDAAMTDHVLASTELMGTFGRQ